MAVDQTPPPAGRCGPGGSSGSDSGNDDPDRVRCKDPRHYAGSHAANAASMRRSVMTSAPMSQALARAT